jgi:peptidoglycan/xylan/chitin deacetylase (PgdA/CDA1 family)
MTKFLYIFAFLAFSLYLLDAQLKFTPLSLSKDNSFLFNSIENIGGNDPVKTLFYGKLNADKSQFEAMSFYPEYLVYNDKSNVLFIQNRMGLYKYDILKNQVKKIEGYPCFSDKAEYVIHRLQKISISPNNRYVAGKAAVSPTKSNIVIYDIENNTSMEIVKDAETTPDMPTCYWSMDSNYLVYQKNHSLYYFSINDYKNKKLLSEDWRWIGRINLKNAYWSKGNYLVWIEDNIIYRSDPNQFLYRSIYKNYLRQGEIIGKIPFTMDNATDSFVYNDVSKKFIVVKDGASIFYYSLNADLRENPYIQLNDNMRFDGCRLFDSGEGILSVKELLNGKLSTRIFLLKKNGDDYTFMNFSDRYLKDVDVTGFSVNPSEDQFVINGSKGAYCFDFSSLSLLWKNESEKTVTSSSVGDGKWIIGGIDTVYYYDSKSALTRPLFASSIDDAGFSGQNGGISAVINGKSYRIDNAGRTITPSDFSRNDLIKDEKNARMRLLSREIDKGFYKEGMYIKDLYSGNQIEITGLPLLRYKLYQPEIKLESSYYYTPDPDKYEVALVFNCIRTSEGIFPVINTLSNLKITSTFFINGNFMDINPVITRELSGFDFQIGNLFQYYVNLTDTNLMMDKNFIRQGLSSNEEKYFKITGKNFAPYWHSPYYAFNESIVRYGLDNGYKFVSFQLDSLDWIGTNDREVDPRYYMNNNGLIDRILENLKPGQIIIFNAGKNGVKRDDWLFNDMDLLITELVRAGYSFTTAGDLSEKYREK